MYVEILPTRSLLQTGTVKSVLGASRVALWVCRSVSGFCQVRPGSVGPYLSHKMV